ncbi:hypothetical protein, partial [Mycobacterium lepromatosis]|uniref:hypothetical protein n=1 Tax=Mycobacterium lepromatosis TaxID=480418 RepID=UPI0005F7FF32
FLPVQAQCLLLIAYMRLLLAAVGWLPTFFGEGFLDPDLGSTTAGGSAARCGPWLPSWRTH